MVLTVEFCRVFFYNMNVVIQRFASRNRGMYHIFRDGRTNLSFFHFKHFETCDRTRLYHFPFSLSNRIRTVGCITPLVWDRANVAKTKGTRPAVRLNRTNWSSEKVLRSADPLTVYIGFPVVSRSWKGRFATWCCNRKSYSFTERFFFYVSWFRIVISQTMGNKLFY